MHENQKDPCLKCWLAPFLAFVFFAMALLLSLRPIFLILEEIVKHFLQNGISEGTATLLGAIIGFGALSWQAKAGFKNLAASQANQASLDRSARDHQQQLAINLENLRIMHKKKSVIASLIGEIGYCLYLINLNIESTNYFLNVIRSQENKPFSFNYELEGHFKSFNGKTIDENRNTVSLIPTDLLIELNKIYYAYGEMGMNVIFKDMPIPTLIERFEAQGRYYKSLQIKSTELKNSLNILLDEA